MVSFAQAVSDFYKAKGEKFRLPKKGTDDYNAIMKSMGKKSEKSEKSDKKPEKSKKSKVARAMLEKMLMAKKKDCK